MRNALAVAGKRIGRTVIIVMETAEICACGKPLLIKIRNGEVEKHCSEGIKCLKK